ncbi:MAG: tail fiber protein, partial [Halobacteriales archaeon]|nr:tail fiber protein [Halobacteriales archaeon]
MPAIETVFVDVTSVVPAAWFNLLQKHLAGYLNLKVTLNGTTTVEIVAASHDGVASAYIGGEMRRNDATVGHTFAAEPADTYNVYVVATAAVDTFGLEVSTTTPGTSPYRKVAEVDWSGSAITALRGVRGAVEDHGHDGVTDPKVSHTDLTGLTSGDPHTQYVHTDGSRPFTAKVQGIDPTSAAHLATKGYADEVLLTVPIGGIFWWPSADSAPPGFILCDGRAVNRTTYDRLFSEIGTTYGNGNGSTTFNLPDIRGRMIVGDSGSLTLGAKGGSIDHSHSQPSHTHTMPSHSHTTPNHNHSSITTGSGGSHSHSQGSTGSAGSHSHTADAHTHSSGTLSVAATGGAVVGSRHGSQGTR